MGRERRGKLTVSIDQALLRSIAEHAGRERIARSQVVEDAIRLWEKSRLAFLAKEGYQEAAEEDLQDAEAYLSALADLVEE